MELSQQIWLAKCKDYFGLFQVPEAMKVTMISMHMEGNTTLWLQVVRLKGASGNCRNFS
jgi:hypothetical protein